MNHMNERNLLNGRIYIRFDDPLTLDLFENGRLREELSQN